VVGLVSGPPTRGFTGGDIGVTYMAYSFTQEMEDVLSSTLPTYMPTMID